MRISVTTYARSPASARRGAVLDVCVALAGYERRSPTRAGKRAPDPEWTQRLYLGIPLDLERAWTLDALPPDRPDPLLPRPRGPGVSTTDAAGAGAVVDDFADLDAFWARVEHTPGLDPDAPGGALAELASLHVSVTDPAVAAGITARLRQHWNARPADPAWSGHVDAPAPGAAVLFPLLRHSALVSPEAREVWHRVQAGPWAELTARGGAPMVAAVTSRALADAAQRHLPALAREPGRRFGAAVALDVSATFAGEHLHTALHLLETGLGWQESIVAAEALHGHDRRNATTGAARKAIVPQVRVRERPENAREPLDTRQQAIPRAGAA